MSNKGRIPLTLLPKVDQQYSNVTPGLASNEPQGNYEMIAQPAV